jgi:hypothetical protein
MLGLCDASKERRSVASMLSSAAHGAELSDNLNAKEHFFKLAAEWKKLAYEIEEIA